ncbi:MAG: sporulation integral membrane protein YtvI [Oscillospiraceae bacterium]|nr:sporulation integral membrane protein YtvI [Oscillospiraceae bacterium]
MEAKKNFIWNVLFYATVLLLVVLVYKYILPILTPFIIGFCVASIVRLPLRKLHTKNPKNARRLSALLCILFYLVIAGLLGLFGARIVTELGAFTAAIPGILETHLYPLGTQIADYVQAVLAPFDPRLTEWVIELGKTVLQSLGQFATDLSASVVKWVANSAVSLPGFVIQVILTIVSTFYFAADYEKVLALFKKCIPEGKRQVIVEALGYAKTAVLAFLKTYSILFSVTFLELSIGLSVLGIPYAILIALAIAIFDLMPVLGTGGILLPWALILLILGNIPLAIGIIVLYVIITAVRNALESRIVGNHIGLHPLATLIAMILGLRLIGLLGMIAFPIALVAAVNFRRQALAAADPQPAAETQA